MLVLRPVLAIVFSVSLLSFSTPRFAVPNATRFSMEETLPEYPPGAMVTFSESQPKRAEKVPINGVFLKRIETNAEQTVWTVPSEQVPLRMAENPTASESVVGFVVPQLPRGAYEAWYESRADGAKVSSTRFTIAPRLLAEDGILRDSPGKEVEVRIRIPIPKIAKRDGAVTELSVLAHLTSRNPNLVEIINNGSQKIRNDGSAVWKVRIIGNGIAEVEATADGFEPAIVNVVGMPGPGATFQDAEVALLKHLIEESQRSEERARKRYQILEAQVPSNRASAGAGRDPAAPGPDIEELRAERAVVAADIAQSQRQIGNAVDLVNQITAQQPQSMKETDLKPGDVLLVLGSSSIISDTIRNFDGQQLGVRGEYSHASLYVGEVNGKKMVAEMWSSGYWITPLSVSTQGSRIVDVFRRDGIDDNKRNEIANRGRTIFGSPERFVRDKSPWFISWGSGLPYAYEEIQVLALAALGAPGLQAYVIGHVDLPAGGRRKMICSELVAWVYQDVGLPLNVQYWSSLSSAGIFISDDRKRDYTTPNMLARSQDLTRVGRYLGP